MSFTSFLKSMEQKIVAVFKTAAKAEPAAVAIAEGVATAAGFPEVVPFIEKIGGILAASGGVVATLQNGPGDGAAKLALAAPMVDNMLKNSGFLSDKVIADEQKWAAAVTGIASHFADLYNSVAPKPPATPPAV